MSTLSVTNISDGTNSTATTNVVKGSAKAWVNFNGTGTPAIRQSYNVSSITDNATGDFTVNFTNALTDTDYAVSVDCPEYNATNNTVSARIRGSSTVGAPDTGTTTQLRVTWSGNTSPASRYDPNYFYVIVFR